MVITFYRPIAKLSNNVRNATYRQKYDDSHFLDDDEKLRRIHLTTVFANKVFSMCRIHNITPWTTKEPPFRLQDLLLDAERELCLAHSQVELALMNRWQRYEVEYLTKQRRQYAYLTFLRLTSLAL